MSAPAVPEQPVPVLPDDALAQLLRAAEGKTFENRRDTAILRPFIDSGMRLSELALLAVDDLDFDLDVAHVIGKGRRWHYAARLRARHRSAEEGALWVGKKGPMTPSGVAQMLARRAKDAGRPRRRPRTGRGQRREDERMTLVEFLTARLDEDEQSAHEAEDSLGRLNMAWSFQPDGDLGGKVLARDHYVMIPRGTTTIAQHIARHGPARVLREVEAKRRLLDGHEPDECSVPCCICGRGEDYPCTTLRLLALPYADHLDYREEWRP